MVTDASDTRWMTARMRRLGLYERSLGSRLLRGKVAEQQGAHLASGTGLGGRKRIRGSFVLLKSQGASATFHVLYEFTVDSRSTASGHHAVRPALSDGTRVPCLHPDFAAMARDRSSSSGNPGESPGSIPCTSWRLKNIQSETESQRQTCPVIFEIPP